MRIAAKGVGQNDIRTGIDKLLVQLDDLTGAIRRPELRGLTRSEPGLEIVGAGGAVGQKHAIGCE